jgi:hypothetical protein
MAGLTLLHSPAVNSLGFRFNSKVDTSGPWWYRVSRKPLLSGMTQTPARTAEQVESLIFQAIRSGNTQFDDIFMFVAKSFVGKIPSKFVDYVYRKVMSLSKLKKIAYDKPSRSWSICDQAD